jgi:hypothetical protein
MVGVVAFSVYRFNDDWCCNGLGSLMGTAKLSRSLLAHHRTMCCVTSLSLFVAGYLPASAQTDISRSISFDFQTVLFADACSDDDD